MVATTTISRCEGSSSKDALGMPFQSLHQIFSALFVICFGKVVMDLITNTN